MQASSFWASAGLVPAFSKILGFKQVQVVQNFLQMVVGWGSRAVERILIYIQEPKILVGFISDVLGFLAWA